MRSVQTAQERGFFPVPLAVMQAGTLAPVNIYIWTRKAGRFVLYKKAGTPFREDTRQRLISNGVHVLYLRKTDEETYHRYVEENIAAIVRDELLPLPKACEIVYETSARVMKNVFQNPRAGKNIPRARAMVEATVSAILKDPDSLWHMTALASHDYYTYTHSVNVSVFLVAASRSLLGITDSEMLKQIGWGGMLHDIGKSEISDKILCKPGRLTPEEFQLVKKHPLMGLDIAMDLKNLPGTSARIIRWHHERLDASGYPDGLGGDEVGPIVRLTCIVDVYDALTTNRPYASARDPFRALDLMREEMKGQLDTEMLCSFIKFLGPKEAREKLAGALDPFKDRIVMAKR